MRSDDRGDGCWRWLRSRPPASASANVPPTTEFDSYRMSSHADLADRAGAPGVLANDSDAGRRPAHAPSCSAADPYGTLDLRRSGRFTYTPPARLQRPRPSSPTRARDNRRRRLCLLRPTPTSSVTRPPQAADDSYGAISGAPRFGGRSPGVLANDVGRARAGSAIRRTTAASSCARTGRFDYTVGSRLRRHRHLHLRGGRVAGEAPAPRRP